MYDPVLDAWASAPPMVAHEGGVGVGVIPKSFDTKDSKSQRKAPYNKSKTT